MAAYNRGSGVHGSVDIWAAWRPGSAGRNGMAPPLSAEPRPASAVSDESRRRWFLIGAACLALAIFLVDTFTPANIEFATLYVLVLMVAGRGTDGRNIWFWAIGCLLASTASFLILVDGATDPAAVALFAIADATILCAAFLIFQQSNAMAIVRRQSRALDVAGTAILLRDIDGEILLWNRAAEELYGWSHREAMGQNADRLLASKLPEPLEAIHAKLGQHGIWEGEIEHHHRDGRSVTVLSRWTVQGQEGQRGHMIVAADLDAHIQKATEMLRQSELRYRTIFDQLAVAVVEHDFQEVRHTLDRLRSSGVTDLARHLATDPGFLNDIRRTVRITGANDTAVRLLEADSKENFFARLDEILPPGDESFTQFLLALWEGRSTFLTEASLRTRRGEQVPVILSLSLPQDGPLDRVTACIVDIRERLRMQAVIDRTRADLEHAMRAASLGELTASIAHEVNQPLSAIMSYAQASRRWMNRQPPNLAEARTALDDTIMAAEHAGNVVKQVRKLLGRAEPDRLPIEIDGIAGEAVRLMRSEASTNDITLQLDLGATGATILGDRILLQQVLVNLLNNAVQAMAVTTLAERAILLDTMRDGDMVRIRIRDTGPGFAAGTVEQVFNAFYTTKPRGMGLGLSICRSTVESHGGTIVAENRADGPGASITVHLPRAV
jgi:PAS domain S-box-containing protein